MNMTITIMPKAVPGIYSAGEVVHMSCHAPEAAIDSHHNVTSSNSIPSCFRIIWKAKLNNAEFLDILFISPYVVQFYFKIKSQELHHKLTCQVKIMSYALRVNKLRYYSFFSWKDVATSPSLIIKVHLHLQIVYIFSGSLFNLQRIRSLKLYVIFQYMDPFSDYCNFVKLHTCRLKLSMVGIYLIILILHFF